MIEMRRVVEDSRSGTETKTETKETKVETAEISIDPRTIELCVRCGTCRSVCPAFEVLGWESKNTRGRVMVAKALGEGLAPDASVLDSLNTCTTCGICAAKCPAGANPPAIVQSARMGLVSQGVMTEAQAGFRTRIAESGNTFGEGGDRLGWLSDPDREGLKESSDLVYFVGCLDSYRYPEVAKKTFDLLKRFGATLLPEEVCCGSPLIRTGSDAGKFVDRNLRQIKMIGAKTVITGCAGCYSTLKKDYPPEFEVVSVPEFLAEHLAELDLRRLDLTVTYHDPCHLGRGSGIFDPPREVIKAICRLEEMRSNRQDARCCGGGGGVRAGYPDLSLEIAKLRLQDVPAGVDAIVSCCPLCIRNLSDASSEVEVIDLVDLVERAIVPP
ncbi:MAG: (Fe-S)-binding protein [Methanothrix sp.]|jgi:Fe-S oxidoreductase|nr:(Fe-S)-binding protein [Methanothrix sp.]HQA61444.1 (Fe-S)-binding protein [Methanothrix sp.]